MRSLPHLLRARVPGRPIGSRGYRWALLGLTVLMGAALIASSVGSFLRARRDAESVAQLSGRRMARTVVREVMRTPNDLQATLSWAISELEEEGLRYAAVCRPRNGCELEAGTPLASPPEPPYVEAPRRPGHLFESLRPHPVADGRRMQLLVPLRPGPPGRHGLGVPRRRLRSLPPHERPDLGVLLLEYEPLAAAAITSRATATLVIGLGSAALLLIITGVVWRLAGRSERYEQQLARDRELKKLGEVSAVLGHQLRNPLASLKGHAQLLLERLPETDPGRAGADTVVAEAARLEALTEQILDFVRTGSVDRQPVPPAELLRGIADRWPPQRVVVEASDAPDVWPLDRARMEQALVNVVDNAVEVSGPDSPIRLVAQTGRGVLILRVIDRGPGLAPEDAERIFEPFYTQRVHGTGLGLALARRIVEGHGGTISAHSGEPGGAEIRMELPKQEEEG